MVSIGKALVLALLISVIVLAGCKEEVTVVDTATSDIEVAAENIIDMTVNENECPHECCTGKDGYDELACESDRPCRDNKCRFDECPYDCCSGYEQYARKLCKEGYACEETDCVAEDDDGDGLLNIEEKKLGTDPKKADTDGDGLSDFEEVKKTKTDPTDENMDDDRYNDKDDPNPFIGAWPVIQTDLKNDVQDSFDDNLQTLKDAYTANCDGKVCNAQDLLPITGDLELFRSQFTVERKNVGDDYTEYTEYSVNIYTVSGGKKKRIYPNIEERLERLDEDSEDEKDYDIIIKLSDIEIGGEGVLVSAALDPDRFVILPEVRSVESEGTK